MLAVPASSLTRDVHEASQVGAARRAAAALTESLGFEEASKGKVTLVVTEAATNLLKHAGGGQIVLSALRLGRSIGLEVLALDRGPGIPDLERALDGGVSTTGSMGEGLAAISRLTDELAIFSPPERGTALVARFWRTRPAVAGAALDLGFVCRPHPGQTACGDAWGARLLDDGRHLLLLADGLGHGPAAAEASNRAVAQLEAKPWASTRELVESLHEELRPTRGAAVAVLELDPAAHEARFVGIGNVQGRVYAEGQNRGMASHNGTVGYGTLRIQEFRYPWPPGALVVLHSDGLGSRWHLGAEPGLQDARSSLIAGVLYRDHARGNDDACVVVLRRPAGVEART